MNDRHFDTMIQSLAAKTPSRRAALTALAGGALGFALTGFGSEEVAARNKHKHKHKKNKGSGGSGPTKGLKETCSPSTDTCSGDLQCSSPTTRHSCSSSVQGVSNWCCVKPGNSCTECDCCGDYYCEPDNSNNFRCVPNPEN